MSSDRTIVIALADDGKASIDWGANIGAKKVHETLVAMVLWMEQNRVDATPGQEIKPFLSGLLAPHSYPEHGYVPLSGNG